MKLARHTAALFLGLSLLGSARVAFADGDPPPLPNQGPPSLEGPRGAMAERVPTQLEGIGIVDKNGEAVPRDVKLTGSDGRSVSIGDYLDNEKPLVIILAYYQCPMLCSLVLNGAADAMKKMPERIGTDYRVLVVSFDPRDKADVAQGKRASYLDSLGAAAPADHADTSAFEFAVGSEEEVKRLADAVGFRYRWDEEQNQYAHAAGIFVVTPGGKLSQAVTGIQFDPTEVSASLREAQKGVSHSPLKSVLLYCFQYDGHTGKYTLAAARTMRVGAGITLGVVGLAFLKMFRNDRKKRASASGGGESPNENKS